MSMNLETLPYDVIISMVTAASKGEDDRFEFEDAYTDDHGECCRFKFDGKHLVDVMWCSSEFTGAILYFDSKRAQRYVTEAIVEELFEGSFVDEVVNKIVEQRGDHAIIPESLSDIFNDDQMRLLYRALVRFETVNELLTCNLEWKRKLALDFGDVPQT